MSRFKKTILAFLILGILGLLLRGWLYRELITYRSIGKRQNYQITEEELKDYIDLKLKDDEEYDVQKIINLSLSLTSEKLNFTASRNHNDPNKLIFSKTAHCVGYATFFSSTCNYLLKKHGLAETWSAKPHIGQLYLLGSNIHRYLDSAFLKDHDFVIIKNKNTGEILSVDPSINDYLWIDFVTYAK